MSLLDDLSKKIGFSPETIRIGRYWATIAWEAIPKDERDRIVAVAIKQAKALAGYALKGLLAYALKRIAEGVPPTTFGDIEALMKSPPFDMPEEGMPLDQKPVEPTP